MSRFILFISRGAESAFSAFGCLKFVYFDECRLRCGHDEKLSNSVAIFDTARGLSVVVKSHHNFSSIIQIVIVKFFIFTSYSFL